MLTWLTYIFVKHLIQRQSLISDIKHCPVPRGKYNAGLTPLRITQKYSSRTVYVKEKSRTWRIRELIRREDVSLRASKSFACVKK